MATSTLGSVRGPLHPTLSAECRKRMVIARTSLITNFAFFGIIAAKLQLVEDNVHCKTLATDGKHFFYNVSFVMGADLAGTDRATYKADMQKAFPAATDIQLEEAMNGLTDSELRAGVVHEVLHCMMEHFIRKGNRNHQKWNKACDYAINQIIKREKLGDIRDSWLFDAKYDEKTAEEIYRMLVDDDTDEDGDSMDHHPDPNAGAGEEGGTDRGTAGSLFEHLSEGEMEDNIESFKQTVSQAASASEVPESLKRMFDELNTPKIDWRTKVKRTLQSWMKQDMSFMRPSRRSWSLGCIMPGYIPQEDIDVCVALDMSGSISEQMAREMISETYGMMKQFPSFKIKLLCFDTRVYNPQDFDETDVGALFSYQIKGGGGTDFDAVWEYMKEENYKPKQLIMFTDGYPWSSWGDENYCDTLFVIHGTKTIIAPFGDTVHYEFSFDEE